MANIPVFTEWPFVKVGGQHPEDAIASACENRGSCANGARLSGANCNCARSFIQTDAMPRATFCSKTGSRSNGQAPIHDDVYTRSLGARSMPGSDRSMLVCVLRPTYRGIFIGTSVRFIYLCTSHRSVIHCRVRERKAG